MPKRGDAIFVAELLPTLKSWHELFQPHFVSFFDAKTRAREKKKRKGTGSHSGRPMDLLMFKLGFLTASWGLVWMRHAIAPRALTKRPNSSSRFVRTLAPMNDNDDDRLTSTSGEPLTPDASNEE